LTPGTRSQIERLSVVKGGAVCCCRRCRSGLNSTWDLAYLALAQAGEAYGGTLLDGAPYAWVEVPREDTRRRGRRRPGLKGTETRMRPVTCWFVWGDSSVR
jgi:hypothetical protein